VCDDEGKVVDTMVRYTVYDKIIVNVYPIFSPDRGGTLNIMVPSRANRITGTILFIISNQGRLRKDKENTTS
jgi:hypothetical protein